MRIITPQEAADWATRHNVALTEGGLPALRNLPASSWFHIPEDAGVRTCLVREQMGNLRVQDECLVWLDDWSVWQSGQWHHLFERFRLSYGCDAPLIEKPAHLVEKSDFDAAVSIAVYAVLMLWDCYVIANSGDWIYYSHDEIGEMKLSDSGK